MCRLALMNKSGFDLLEERIGAIKYFDFLEKQCGGHGNGLAISDGKKVRFLKKGIQYTNKMIVDDIKSFDDFKYLIYHTRVSSAGKISTPNCHPFLKEHICLAMNGTESSFAAMGRAIDKTDTELVLDYLIAVKKPIDELKYLTANYMGFDHGKVFFVNNKDLDIMQQDDAFVIGSSFPSGIDSKLVSNHVWKEGEKLSIKEKVKYSPPSYGSYVNGVWHPVVSAVRTTNQSSIWNDIESGYKADLEKGILD